MRKRLTTEEFIEKARKVHGNKYDYSKVDYVNWKTKICIICPEHGEFWQIPNNHLRGNGCLKCGGSAKSTTEEFIEKARKVHGNKYNYSKVIYINNGTKILIICPEHGEFYQIPSNHLSGQGCPSCSGTKKSTTEEFIEKARKVHGNKYNYSKVIYINNETKIPIICPEHGEFWQTPINHLMGQGCPKCGGTAKLTIEEFIEKAREVHGNKYDYSRVDYKDNKTKVCMICPEHGEFYQKPSNHLRGQGCPGCANRPKLDNTQPSHRVYIFDFPDKIRYVGLTMKSIDERDYEHRHGRIHSNGTYSSAVYKYSIEFNTPIPKPSIFRDNLTPEEAQYWEGWVIEDSRRNGYTLLNVAKAGGLGGYTY